MKDVGDGAGVGEALEVTGTVVAGRNNPLVGALAAEEEEVGGDVEEVPPRKSWLREVVEVEEDWMLTLMVPVQAEPVGQQAM